MKTWIIAGIVVGLLLIAGIVVSTTGLVSADAVDGDQAEETETTISCSTCGNSCTAERNCGRSSCGAVSGGSCGCRGN